MVVSSAVSSSRSRIMISFCARKSSLRSYIQEFSTPFWEVYDRVDTDFGPCILDAGVCRGRVTPTHKRMLALLLEYANTLHITLAFSQLAENRTRERTTLHLSSCKQASQAVSLPHEHAASQAVP